MLYNITVKGLMTKFYPIYSSKECVCVWGGGGERGAGERGGGNDSGGGKRLGGKHLGGETSWRRND